MSRETLENVLPSVPEEPLENGGSRVEEEDEECESDEDGLAHRDESVEGALPTSHPLQRVHLHALRHETTTEKQGQDLRDLRRKCGRGGTDLGSMVQLDPFWLVVRGLR